MFKYVLPSVVLDELKAKALEAFGRNSSKVATLPLKIDCKARSNPEKEAIESIEAVNWSSTVAGNSPFTKTSLGWFRA